MQTPLVEPARPLPSGGVAFMRKFNTVVLQGSYFGEVTGPFTARQCLNLHKLLVLPVELYMIWHFGGDLSLKQAWGPAAAVLLVCHTTYGFFWVYKDIFFPDASWQIPMNVIGFISIFFYPLALYYLPMFCLVSRKCPLPYYGEGNEPWLLAIGLWFYITGFFYHFCADLQKYIQLQHQRPRSLITTGLMAHTRNPNYFGEVTLYIGYAILSTNCLSLPLFSVVWLQVFAPNMLAKGVSMSRHQAWKSWEERTGFLVPWLPSMLRDFLKNALSKLPKVDSEES